MKALSGYTDNKITECVDRNGAFWAFSTSQFNEAKKDGVTYVNLPTGLICPEENAKSVLKEMDDIFVQAKKEYLSENSKESIIKYELSNHECYYTGDWMEAFYMVEEYGFTRDEVYDIYREELPKSGDY